jgi:hypothetical protein
LLVDHGQQQGASGRCVFSRQQFELGFKVLKAQVNVERLRILREYLTHSRYVFGRAGRYKRNGGLG